MTLRLRERVRPAEAFPADRDPHPAISRVRRAILLNSLFIALVERIRRELQDRFRVGQATIQLETAHPEAADPSPIHHEGEAVQR